MALFSKQHNIYNILHVLFVTPFTMLVSPVSAGQRLIFNLWKEKSAGPMHFLHMGYGIGSFIVPLYSNPFLAIPIPSATTANATNASMEAQTDNLFSNVSTGKSSFMQITEQPKAYLRESRIEYAYAISACLVALLSVIFYYYQIEECRIYKKARLGANKEELHELNDDKQKQESDGIKSRSFREMFNPGSCSGGRTWYAVQLLVVLFLYFGNSNGGERLIGGFIRSYSVDQLGFGTYEASYLNTSFWISFTVGRFTFFIAARWIGIRKLVIIETCGVTVIAILMNIFATNNPVAYWVLIQPLGFFESPMWPSMMAWSDYHIELTGVGMTVMLFAGGIGGICHLRLIGYLYEHKGPRTFLYQVLGFGILALTLAIILTTIGAQHGSRFKWDRDTSVQVNNEPVQTELLLQTSENADTVKGQQSSNGEEI